MGGKGVEGVGCKVEERGEEKRDHGSACDVHLISWDASRVLESEPQPYIPNSGLRCAV